MLLLVSLILSLNGNTSFAKEKAHEHREHGAHVHGSATVSIAFDQLKGKIEFKSPNDSISGFEYKAESEKDKKIQEQALASLENNIAQMISFEPSLGCLIKKEKIEVILMSHEEKNSKKNEHKEAMHSETQAVFNVLCAKSPVGSKVTFNFQKYFSKLKDVDVQILADQLQKSAEAQHVGTVVELK